MDLELGHPLETLYNHLAFLSQIKCKSFFEVKADKS